MANRLADETSPYLRQHADNPVDWYPWGDEAFDRARELDRPVLLSVGYSSCHWCHVMAHESFEDPVTAALMNERFVSVKVDREERPDVDAIYMEAVQAMTGQGGWPMTVFLMPDGRPFFGGTYFPKVPRGGMVTFSDLLTRIDELWRTRRADITDQAGALTDAIGQSGELAPSDVLPGLPALELADAELARRFDPEWGGFGGAPKFPQTMSLELLLRAYRRTGDDELLGMVTTSLDAMAAGGIYDHLGGGFARYSVDDRWLVPHFEKMLYDQALIARVYLHAWQVTGEDRYLQVLDETLGYVLRVLRQPAGGFSSAEDADSEGVEGEFYVWTEHELLDVLGPDAAEALAWWGVTPQGNFEGRNILWRPVRGDLDRSPAVEAARQRLFDVREARVHPGLDDKALTEWNALLIATLAEAAAATGRVDWIDAAVAGAEFLLDHLRRPDGRWLRSWQAAGPGSTGSAGPAPAAGSGETARAAGSEETARAAGSGELFGTAQHLAYAADHAALVDMFVRLAEATGEARWVEEARATADAMIELFWDHEQGGLFTTGTDAEVLITRPKDLLDSALPSANSTAAQALLRLSALTGDLAHHDRAEQIVRLLAAPAGAHPLAFAHLLGAADMLATGLTEVAVAGDRADLVQVVHQAYLPNVVLAWGERYASPVWEGRQDGLAYVCRGWACLAPVSDPAALATDLSAAT